MEDGIDFDALMDEHARRMETNFWNFGNVMPARACEVINLAAYHRETYCVTENQVLV